MYKKIVLNSREYPLQKKIILEIILLGLINTGNRNTKSFKEKICISNLHLLKLLLLEKKMIVYVLRHFDMERCDPGDIDTFDAEIIQIFVTKQLLFDYCQEAKIELDLDFEWDTSWQNYACDTWLVRGYDYIKLDLLDLFKSCIGNKDRKSVV